MGELDLGATLRGAKSTPNLKIIKLTIKHPSLIVSCMYTVGAQLEFKKVIWTKTIISYFNITFFKITVFVLFCFCFCFCFYFCFFFVFVFVFVCLFVFFFLFFFCFVLFRSVLCLFRDLPIYANLPTKAVQQK